ncbi:MAG: cytochrome c oxidase subunit 3 [Gammaproteobacteria bacterium]|nr:cytochrome c oxidase subunit 3 [Gammaproteobacteria bacterium]
MAHHQSDGSYYLPEPSHWPIVGSIALFCTLTGFANWLHHNAIGPYLFFAGALIMAYMLFGWFGTVIKENRAGLLSGKQVDHSFRWGMCWFIFSEVMFFGAFFGALFYARMFAVPWLGGEGHGAMTHLLLWPGFHATWPLLKTPNPASFHGPKGVMETWGIPAINTLILLSSGATVTVAHWAVIKNRRKRMLTFQLITALLGIAFLSMQAHEYWLAYTTKGLKLTSGIYGTTFFMLTGFHAAHVTIGTIGLFVIWYRMLRRDFNSENHFGFEAISWYWHFVDVVWLFLFIFVYWL